jgi:23S rRNA (uracil1939-C5)-methyltransferase
MTDFDLTPPINPMHIGPEIGYRNKLQMSVAGKGKTLSLGLNRFHSQFVESISECPVSRPEINETVPILTHFLAESDATWIQVAIRVSATSHEKVVVLWGHFNEPIRAYINRNWSQLNVTGLVVVDEAGTVRGSFGSPTLTETILDIQYQVSWNSFFQANRALLPDLVSCVVDAISPQPHENGLDLYGGLGLFGLHLAQRSAGIVSVEQNPNTVADAIANAARNHITSFTAVAMDVESYLTQFPTADYAVIDPPRTGLSPAVIEALISHGPDRLVYVSCNPQTFARDAVQLQSRYDIDWITPFDMFPNMAHLELVSHLKVKST